MKCGLAIAIGSPFAIAGLILCASVIGILIGIPLLAFSGYPLMTVIRKRVVKIGVGHLDQGSKPWES